MQSRLQTTKRAICARVRNNSSESKDLDRPAAPDAVTDGLAYDIHFATAIILVPTHVSSEYERRALEDTWSPWFLTY
jgi:hypothetical protein